MRLPSFENLRPTLERSTPMQRWYRLLLHVLVKYGKEGRLRPRAPLPDRFVAVSHSRANKPVHKLLFPGSWAALVLLLSFSAAVAAGDSDRSTYDRISLSVSVEEEVEADRLVAVLAAQREGTDAAKLASEVNTRVDWALDQAQGEAEVESETLGYTTSPLYTKGTLSGWRVRQEIRLRSLDGTALSGLVGRLQGRLLLQSIGYEVSDGRRKEAQEALIRAGIDAFKGRARLIAEQMGQPRYRLVEMRVETDGDRPVPIFRGGAVASVMAEADRGAVAPRIEAGKQTIRVRISGIIELQVQ